jgi:tyrosine-protein phosphatase SIW14
MIRRIAIAACLLLASCAAPLHNLHRVDGHVWRSSQPDAVGFQDLKSAGSGEVLSLRHYHADDRLADGLVLHRVPMDAERIHDSDIVAALKVLTRPDKPVLVHCWHGSDRTGVVVAMYRMVVQDWSREKAIAELNDPAYGHHAGAYPNIQRYLETVDVEKIRRELRSIS